MEIFYPIAIGWLIDNFIPWQKDMQSTTASIKQKLHFIIECIDDEKILKAIYILLGNLRNEGEDHELTDEQLKELEKREADHLAGKTKSYSLEEFKNIINKNYGY